MNFKFLTDKKVKKVKLTKKQQIMYDIEKIIGGSVNVICGSVVFDKSYDIEKMSEAVNELYRINDALRIRLVSDGGKISQYVDDFSLKDIETVSFTDKQQFHDFAQAQAYEPLDIYGSLCEIKILSSPYFSGILYKLHHIIADAWTLALLASQFNRILNGKDVVAYSYKEYMEEDGTYLISKRYLKDKEFYIDRFKKCSEPVYISEKNVKTNSAKRITFSLNKATSSSIYGFTENKQVSPATFFLTAISVYLNRIKNNCESFYIGLPIINRTGTVEKNTAGLFINTAPTLIETENNKSFSENIDNIEVAVMTAMRHQKFTYEDVMSALKDEFGFTGNLYDVIFSYQNAQIDGESFESTWYHNGIQNESLQIHIDDRDNTKGFKIHYDYQTEKFTENDIEKLHNHLFNLISDAIADPDKKITDLEMLSDVEKKILYEFNNTNYSYNIPNNSTLYSLFEKTAKENPDNICITTAERNIIFSELHHISEKLDTELRGITKGEKSVIAVISERSVEMYAAIYGIIRGGNAYLPIDPNYPQERIDYILENSNAKAVIAQGKFCHLAGNVPCIDMTAFIENADSNTSVTYEYAAEPDDTAYVIYTSGSTGNPKGARVSHKSAVNRILWMHDKYPLRTNGVILQKTPYTFDVSVWELFWWGISGGSLAASKPGEHFLPAKILEEVQNKKVTHLHFVPSVFELFLKYLEAHKDELHKFDSVRYVFLSGEALSADLVRRFYKLYDFEKVTLHNLYGPTECAVDVTYYDCAPSDTDPVPIGKPIYNTQIHILDKYLKPVSTGVMGEICIAGVNVGQGYLNNSVLTNEKFINNPFREGKLYRTGDNGYWREDGNIIFCGRKDGQIKLNGQRIETGEIESVICELNDIDSVAVIVKKIQQGDVLVAFYAGKNDCEKIIREHCLSRLPKYMVPGAIERLDSLPLNQNGKLDRKILSDTHITFTKSDENDKPINETEKLICKAFETVLSTENIGRNSDFFDMGGTSISMISLLGEEGFENITAAEFMRNPTPSKLSRIMHNRSIETLEYLEPLHIAENSERVIILLPFAGGGAEAYSNFVNTLKNTDSRISVYFIRYLHSSSECEEAANEILEVLNGKEISLYSHCVGSSVALYILNKLEKELGPVKHYFAGASIPPKKPSKNNIWNIVPNAVLRFILLKAGADFSGLNRRKTDVLLKEFRKDTDFANIGFFEFGEKIKTPVSVIISKNDIFTKNYTEAEKLWLKYFDDVCGVHFIDTKSHYFQRDNAKNLIDVILKLI